MVLDTLSKVPDIQDDTNDTNYSDSEDSISSKYSALTSNDNLLL